MFPLEHVPLVHRCPTALPAPPAQAAPRPPAPPPPPPRQFGAGIPSGDSTAASTPMVPVAWHMRQSESVMPQPSAVPPPPSVPRPNKNSTNALTDTQGREDGLQIAAKAYDGSREPSKGYLSFKVGEFVRVLYDAPTEGEVQNQP